MSFFKMSDGTAPTTNGTAEMGGGNLPPIPSGTQVKAAITEAKWEEPGQYAEKHIKLRWDVVDGDYKKRVIFQKVRVANDDANKRDKAIRMLAAIDANCGGKLMQLNAEPTDMDLMQSLCNRPMVIKLEVWEMEGSDGETRSGNWVQAVSSGKAQPPQQQAQQAPAQPQATETNNPDANAMNDNIGF